MAPLRLAAMAQHVPRTEFVRRIVASRPLGWDGYAAEILELERLLASLGPRGFASGMAFLNFSSRYPRETEAIRRELGATDGDSRVAWERIAQLLEERLRIAETRRAGEVQALFEP